jgi:hypothetical protein
LNQVHEQLAEYSKQNRRSQLRNKKPNRS